MLYNEDIYNDFLDDIIRKNPDKLKGTVLSYISKILPECPCKEYSSFGDNNSFSIEINLYDEYEDEDEDGTIMETIFNCKVEIDCVNKKDQLNLDNYIITYNNQGNLHLKFDHRTSNEKFMDEL